MTKSEGWQWQKSRVTDPERASRQWVALALATLWLVEVGHEAERLGLPTGSGKGVRTHRLFQVGLAVIVARLVRGEELPRGSFRTQPWPPATATCDPLTEEQMRAST